MQIINAVIDYLFTIKCATWSVSNGYDEAVRMPCLAEVYLHFDYSISPSAYAFGSQNAVTSIPTVYSQSKNSSSNCYFHPKLKSLNFWEISQTLRPSQL